MKKRTALWIQVSLGYITPLVLQLYSFFSNTWVVEDGLSRGLFYQCDGKNKWGPTGCSLNLLDQATIGLEGTAAVLITLGCVYSVLSVCLYGPDKYDDIDNDESFGYTANMVGFYCCSVAMYPITAILILSGCIRLGTQFHTEQLGAAFYCCTVAGCLHFVLIVVSCCDCLCKRKHEEFVFKTFIEEMYNDAI